MERSNPEHLHGYFFCKCSTFCVTRCPPIIAACKTWTEIEILCQFRIVTISIAWEVIIHQMPISIFSNKRGFHRCVHMLMYRAIPRVSDACNIATHKRNWHSLQMELIPKVAKLIDQPVNNRNGKHEWKRDSFE